MSYGSKIRINSVDYSIASSLYGTCSTSSGTAAKVVTCADFDTLITGVLILVKFDYTNTAASPTLNVNSTGAIAIYTDGNNAPGTTELKSWKANEIVPFVYDGTYWMMAADRKAVQDAITTNASGISTINGQIGTTALPTTAQTITGAIDEHETDISGHTTSITNINNKIGTTALPTTAQTLTGAIKEHEDDLAALPGTASPKMDGTAAVGTATKFARQDHVHPTDTSRAAQSSLNTTNTNVSNLTTTVNGKETKKLIFTSKSASSWTNNGSTAFPKRCAIACTGVTAAMTALVFFSAAQAESGDYSPYAETYAGGVYIYSTKTTSITVPKILVFAGS
jgi:hypothetical protein